MELCTIRCLTLTALFMVNAGCVVRVGAAQEPGATQVVACIRSEVGQERIARVDPEQHRLVLVLDEGGSDAVEAFVRRVRQCFPPGSTDQGWKLSIFSARELAGYKDEPRLLFSHQGNAWAKGYLGEYDSSSAILTLRPVGDAERRQLGN
jgi:hypothetical protein